MRSKPGVGYGEWLHGEAVAAGMVLAAQLSERLGMIAGADVVRLRALLQRAGLPVDAPRLGRERYLALMSRDKKVVAGSIRFVLLDALGAARLRSECTGAQTLRAVLGVTSNVFRDREKRTAPCLAPFVASTSASSDAALRSTPLRYR